MVGFAEWLGTTSLSVWVQTVGWVIPLLQAIHILMIGIVFVSILMIALRVLGRARTDQPFGQVWSRFAPFMWTGLVVMAVTGVLLVVGEPVREFTSLSFWLKMALISIGVASALAFRRSLRAAGLADGREPEFSGATRSAAVATVALWIAIVFLGRAIAYDVAVWGTLSPAAGA